MNVCGKGRMVVVNMCGEGTWYMYQSLISPLEVLHAVAEPASFFGGGGGGGRQRGENKFAQVGKIQQRVDSQVYNYIVSGSCGRVMGVFIMRVREGGR